MKITTMWKRIQMHSMLLEPAGPEHSFVFFSPIVAYVCNLYQCLDKIQNF